MLVIKKPSLLRLGRGKDTSAPPRLREAVKSIVGGMPASPGNRQYVCPPLGRVISMAAASLPSSPTPAASSRMRALAPLDQSLIAAEAGTATSAAAATAAAMA